MTRFVAVYESPTVNSAQLLAISAEPRLVTKFFEELLREAPARADKREPVESCGPIVELARDEPNKVGGPDSFQQPRGQVSEGSR